MGTIINSSRISSSSMARSLCRARAIDCITPATINSASDDEMPGTVADFAMVCAKPAGAASDQRDWSSQKTTARPATLCRALIR